MLGQRPVYYHGQLLQEEDFNAEQQFHLGARYRHVRNLHGFGVANGLEVTQAGDMAISVSAGFAVDRKGREIELREPEMLALRALPTGGPAWVTIGYRTERPDKGAQGGNRIACYAELQVATRVEQDDVRLARLQLDERGRLVAVSIADAERDQLRTALVPGSVTAEALHIGLRKDWVTMAFHPSNLPQDADDTRPPFRVGATEARAHKLWPGKEENVRGAGGTMAIVLPPGVRRIHRLRVAGAANEKGMTVRLLKGGFDRHAMTHLREEMVRLDIGPGPYCKTESIPKAHRRMDDRLRTLAVEIRAEGFVMVSLVGLQVSY